MKCKKIISELAVQDIKEVALWYNSKKKGLGKEFTAEIRKTVHYIIEYPLAFPIKYNEIRLAVVAVFPYTIHYFFDKSSNTVFVTAIYNDARNPDNWKNR
jgi:toxin ParE1/3/4